MDLRTPLIALAAALLLCAGAGAAPLQRSAAEVLLVYNSNSPTSTAIANYYEQQRGITNVLAVQCPDSALNALNENLPLALYNVEIATPVKVYLSRHRGINFIVLTKGIPIRIAGTYLGNIGTDSYSYYNNINLTGAKLLKGRVANPGGAGTIQICLDSATGTVIGTFAVPHTGSYEKWATASCHIAATGGTHTLYLNYSGGFNLEWFSLGNYPTVEVQAAAFDGASNGLQNYASSEGGAATGSEPIGTSPQNYTPSVDSYLAALDYSRLPGVKKASITGSGATGVAWINRYYHANVPFTHAKFGGYLVTRLDGYTQADAEALVDNALAATQHLPRGPILLDVQPYFGVGDKTTEPSATAATLVKSEADYSTWNADLLHAGDILEASGIPSNVDTTGTFAGGQVNLLGYFSWGSNDEQFNADAYESLGFAPGAIGDTAVSTSARTFLPTSGGQTLITDLIAQGITGVRGYVNEPLLNAISSPTVDLSFYLSGYTLAESFYAGSKYIGWEDINIGDPLCAPYFGANVTLTTPTQASSCNISSSGVQTENCSESALDVGYINNGGYTAYNHVALGGISSFIARVASGGPGGAIQVTMDSPTGAVIGTCPVPPTGNWQTWITETCNISGASGTHNLYLVFTGTGGYLFNVQWFTLEQGTIPKQLLPGGTVSFQAMDDGAFISTGTNGTPTLAATSGTAGATEKYLVVDAGNGNIALQSAANGEYVSVDNGSSSPLAADQTSMGPNTTFTEVDLGGNNIALLSMANGLYLSTDLGQQDEVWAESISVSPAETFNISTY